VAWRGPWPLKKGKASFCEQKEAKKLFYAGPWALSPTPPMAQHNKSFCGAFFKKRLLASAIIL
jgi:hypothetical protein